MTEHVLRCLILLCSGFFADGGSSAQAEFLKSASALRESYRFAHTNNEDLLKKYDIDGESVPFTFTLSFRFRFSRPRWGAILKHDFRDWFTVTCLQGYYSLPTTGSGQQVWGQQCQIQWGDLHQCQNQAVHPGQHVSFHISHRTEQCVSSLNWIFTL